MFVCLHAYIIVCTYVSILLWMKTFIYICIYIHVFMYLCMNVGVYLYFMYGCMHICMYISCTSVGIFVCICVYSLACLEKRWVCSCGNVTYRPCTAHPYWLNKCHVYKAIIWGLPLKNIQDTWIFRKIGHLHEIAWFYTCLHAFGKLCIW